MGLVDKFIDKEKAAQVTLKSPREVYSELLKQASGTGRMRSTKYNIFYQIVAFKGVTEGVGCSTLVANTAIAVADLGLTVCVVDTSIMSPVQDILLRTNYKDRVTDKEDRLDWFDLPFTKASVLHESKIRSNIAVLSFYGKDRGIIDALSVNDTIDLVDRAFTELHTKYDLVLVDCCHELTSVNTASLQQSQHVVQVWSDSPTVLSNIDNFINTCATLSCPLDKMRNIVYSKVMDDIVGDLDSITEQYKLKVLARNPFSKDIARQFVLNKVLYQTASKEEDIIAYTECIIDIACHVCNLHADSEPKGTITSNDIMNGKVEGTLTKNLKDFNDELDEKLHIPKTLEEMDSQAEAQRQGKHLDFDYAGNGTKTKHPVLSKEGKKVLLNEGVETTTEPVEEVVEPQEEVEEVAEEPKHSAKDKKKKRKGLFVKKEVD